MRKRVFVDIIPLTIQLASLQNRFYENEKLKQYFVLDPRYIFLNFEYILYNMDISRAQKL